VIAQIQGQLISKEPTRVVVSVGGIGFELLVPLSTSRQLPNCGEPVTLLVVFKIDRSGVQLYGFSTPEEKEVFELLTSVKGVGPKAALNLLSRWQPEEITTAIRQGKTELLRSAPGIGPKKVDAILKRFSESVPVGVATSADLCKPTTIADALNALVSLGLTRKEAQERLNKLKITPEMNLQDILKQALAQKG